MGAGAVVLTPPLNDLYLLDSAHWEFNSDLGRAFGQNKDFVPSSPWRLIAKMSP